MSRPNQEIAKIFIAEYKLVRDELLERTKFRDNLPLISLGFFGAIIAFGLGDLKNLDYSAILLKSSNNPISSLALYVLPYVSMVLGFFWWSVELKVITLVRSAISIADEVNKILPNDGENVLLHAGRAPKYLSITRRWVDLLSTILCFAGPPIISQLILKNGKIIEQLKIIYAINWLFIAIIIIFICSAFVFRIKVIPKKVAM